MSRLTFHRLARPLLRLCADERGTNAVEFALVAPLLIGLLFGIFEFGRAVWTQGILDYAVQQASRCASINTTTCSNSTTTKTFAAAQTAPLSLPTSVFTVTTPSCGNLVSASYVFTFIGSLPKIDGTTVLPTSITLTSSSCFPI